MENLNNENMLIRYLTEEVSAEEKVRIDQWCAMSSENQKTLEQLYFALRTSDCLKTIKSVDHKKALNNLKDRIRRKEAVTRRRFFILNLQRVAAALLLPVIMISAWLLGQKDEIPVQYVELHSNPGMIASFELPDGSKVWLNGGSRLRYPAVFKGENREVEMSGQGYFEIAHNEKKPFVIRKGESFYLEVLGTSFNLSAYDDEDIIETTLVEGSVRLLMLQNGRMVQRVMKPNEKVIYAVRKDSESIETATTVSQNNNNNDAETSEPAKTETVKIATVDPQYDIAWKDQQILFKNHPMEQVIRKLGRYYNVQFLVKDDRVMDSEITGRFSNEQLPQVMEYLSIASGIKYNILPASVENEEIKQGVVEIWK